MKETTTINSIGIKDRYVRIPFFEQDLSDHVPRYGESCAKDGLTANLLY